MGVEMSRVLPRKVAFYRITTTIDPSTNQPRPFDVFAHLHQFASEDYALRCMPLNADIRRAVGTVEPFSGPPVRMRVAITDREERPQWELEDHWQEGRPPAAGYALGVKSHACFFKTPTYPIVGFVPDTNGPTCQMLCRVLTGRSLELQRAVEFEEIFRGNPIERVERSVTGRFMFGIRRAGLEALQEFAPDLASAFLLLAQDTGADIFELTVKVERFTANHHLGGRSNRFLRFLKRIHDGNPAAVPKAVASIRENDAARSLLLNLLTDKFVVDVGLASVTNRRRYRDETAYDAIIHTYTENEAELLHSMSLMGAVTRG
jgi:hypothetical protein